MAKRVNEIMGLLLDERRRGDALAAQLAENERALSEAHARVAEAQDRVRTLTHGEAFVVVPRDLYEALMLQLNELRTQKSMLEIRCATAQTNFDWLAAQMNELRVERAALFDRVLQLKVPAPQIHYAPPLEGADTQYAPTSGEGAPANYGDVLAIAREAVEKAKRARTDASSVTDEALTGLFEDIGDDEAKKLGLRHDESAEVIG